MISKIRADVALSVCHLEVELEQWMTGIGGMGAAEAPAKKKKLRGIFWAKHERLSRREGCRVGNVKKEIT